MDGVHLVRRAGGRVLRAQGGREEDPEEPRHPSPTSPAASPPPRDLGHALEQAVDLVFRRVAGGAGAHDAVRGLTEALDDRGRVEVAVGQEERAPRERVRPPRSDVRPATVNATVGVRGRVGGGP